MIITIGVVHLIKFYSGEGKKYPEVSRIKYLVLLKYNVGPNTKKYDRILI